MVLFITIQGFSETFLGRIPAIGVAIIFILLILLPILANMVLEELFRRSIK